MAARVSARVSTGIPRRRASTTSGLSAGMAVDTVTTSASPTLSAAWPTVARRCRPRQALGHGRRLQVAAGDRVAHGVQHGGDGAHARPADAHHVHGQRAARDRPSGPVAAPVRSPSTSRLRGGRALASTTRAPAAAASGRPSEAAAAPWPSSRPGRPAVGRASSARRPGVAVGVGEQHRGPRPLEHPGVGRLVVAGRPGQRHQDRRHPGHGQLGHGHGPGPAHHHVGGGVDQRPSAPRRAPGPADRATSVGRRCAPVPGPAGPPATPPSPAGRRRGRSTGRPGSLQRSASPLTACVDPAGPERAPEDGHREPVLGQARARAGPADGRRGRRSHGGDLRAHRGAGHHRPGQRVALPARPRWPGRTAEQPVGRPGHGVHVDQHQRHPEDHRGQRRRQAGVAAHRHHHPGTGPGHHDRGPAPWPRPGRPAAPTLAPASPGSRLPRRCPARAAG